MVAIYKRIIQNRRKLLTERERERERIIIAIYFAIYNKTITTITICKKKRRNIYAFKYLFVSRISLQKRKKE